MRKLVTFLAVLLLASSLHAQAATDGPKSAKAAKKATAAKTKGATKAKDSKTQQCAATTKAGKQCSRMAASGEKYCTQHLKMKKK